MFTPEIRIPIERLSYYYRTSIEPLSNRYRTSVGSSSTILESHRIFFTETFHILRIWSVTDEFD